MAAAESSESSSQILEVVEVPACLDAIASANSQRNLRVKLYFSKISFNIFSNQKLIQYCCKCCNEDIPDDEDTVSVDQNGVENHNFENFESEKEEIVENNKENNDENNEEKVMTDL